MFKLFKKNKEIEGLKFCDINPSKYNKIISTLTNEEKKVYTEIVQGSDLNEISKELKIKKNSFNNCLKSILRKLNVKSYKDLIYKYGGTFNYLNEINTD